MRDRKAQSKGVRRFSKESWVGIKHRLLDLALQYIVTCLNCELNQRSQRNVSTSCAILNIDRSEGKKEVQPSTNKVYLIKCLTSI